MNAKGLRAVPGRLAAVAGIGRRGGDEGVRRGGDEVPKSARAATEGSGWERVPALDDLDRAAVCEDVRVRNFLATHNDPRVVVSAEGVCFAVRGELAPRVERGLMALVATRVGKARVVHVTPLDYQRWRGQDDDEAETGETAAARRSNLTVQYVFEEAIAAGASDVYLDVIDGGATLAFRTYGFKRRFQEMSKNAGLELARAMWTQGGGSLNEAGTSGVSFDIYKEGKVYRVRGSSLPDARNGLSVVCRVRDPSFVLPLAASGYAPAQVEHIGRMCRAPGGIILVTGETNSGKSTTLISLLSDLPDTQKVISIEDPVEVYLPHVTHYEINYQHKDAEKIFQEVMAETVRQNPDTLALGEIRDAMTAAAAEKMAIQGKRVFSTLHTQSCVAAIPRLGNLGVERELLGLGSFLAGIVNQNLVPVVCTECGLDRLPDRESDERYRKLFGDRAPLRFRNPQGCEACSTGVRGQTLVAEVYPLCLDRKGVAQEFILEGRLASLERHLRNEGVGGTPCMTKHQHAAAKVARGEIDPVETEIIIGEFHKGDVAKSDNVVALRV